MAGRSNILFLESDGLWWAWTAVEVKAALDLTRRSDFARLEMSERLASAVREQASFLDRLLSVPPGAVVALRMTRVRPGVLRASLIGRVVARDRDAAAASAAALCSQLADAPSHVQVDPVEDREQVQDALTPFAPVLEGLAQVAKRVRTQGGVRPDAGVDRYLAVEPFSRQVEDWNPLLASLAQHPNPVSLTVALAPQQVSNQVRRMLEEEAARYERLREPFDTIADTGGRMRYPADSAASLLQPIFVDALRRYADRAFQFTVSLASSQPLERMLIEAVGRTLSPGPIIEGARHDPTTVATGYTALRPNSTGQYEMMRRDFATLGVAPLPDPQLVDSLARDRHSGRHALENLRFLVDRAEALSLFRLPIAFDGHVPGFPVAAPPDLQRLIRDVDGPSVQLGSQAEDGSGAVKIRTADLPRHAFIVGTPGSGKTNTALHLCRQLWQHRIPFLVVEPVNAELNDYRWLATQPGFEDLLVFTVGNESVAPFRLNPFEVPINSTVTAHISNLLACFEAAFGLWDPLPFIYRRALVRTYRARGYHPDDVGRPELAGSWPVLENFVSHLRDVTGELGYTGEVGHNIDAAARLRAEALAEGACGPTLNSRRSFDIAHLLSRPVVMELAGVGDNAKEQALVTLLLLAAVRGHRRASPGSGTHVLLLEEAHRIFPRAAANNRQGSSDAREGNAQALAAERIAQGLAEDRKYGQSYVLIDQQVGKVSEDAYKITNLKVMHRTAASEDRELLGSTMSMHPDQVESAAALKPFQAVVSHNGLDRAVTLTIPDVRGDDAAQLGVPEAPLADDADLRARFTSLVETSQFADAMAPYGECRQCQHRCAFRRRAESVVASGETAKDLVDLGLTSNGGYQAIARRLGNLLPDISSGASNSASRQALEDYRVCVFIHAFRAIHPPGKWTDHGRRRAITWADRVRRQVGNLSSE